MDLELRYLGSRPLDLDHAEFAYAGKFAVESRKTAAYVEADVAAVAAFDDDRVRPAARIRYVSVRRDLRGRGLGPALLEFTVEHLEGYDSVLMSVNNVFAYEAAHRARFEYTGERGPLGEVVVGRPVDGAAGYAEGVRALLELDPPEVERDYALRLAEEKGFSIRRRKLEDAGP